MPAPLILGGLATVGGLAKFFGANRQDKKLTGMVNALGEYQADPNVAANLALAKNFYNSRSAGATLAENNILSNQADITAAIERNATDASQALSMIGALQGSTNMALADLALKEAADQQQRYGIVQNAVQLNNQEKGRVWQDKLRKLNTLMGIKSTKYANQMDAISDMAGGMAMAVAGGGREGGDLLSLFKGKK